MSLSIQDELYFTLHRALRELIPPPEDRELLTWKTVPHAFAYMVPLHFMGYLVRRRDTHLIRLLLLPTTIVLALRGTFGYDWFEPDYYFFSWLRGLAAWNAVATALEFAFVKEGRFKLGETRLPAINEDVPPPAQNGATSDTSKRKGNDGWLPAWAGDTFDVLNSLRGLGWDVGKSVCVPKEYRPLQRGPFLRATATSFLTEYLIVDTFTELFKQLPGIGSFSGGSLFYHDIPLFYRYIVSTLIFLPAAQLFISGLHMLHNGATLIGVGLLKQSPMAWPPLMQNPWAADSLHGFWARRWHQYLRRTFLTLGGYPGQWLAGRVGFVLGAFFASGLFHEGGLYLIGRGVDHRVTLFFVMQGVGILCETAYKRVTGRKVGGIGGRIWAIIFVVGLGQICLDAWFCRGLAAATFLPPALSPTKRILIPVAKLLFERYDMISAI